MNDGSDPTLDPATLQTASEAFDELCKSQWEKGRREYGDFSFLKVNTLEFALEELADLANYARMTFIKVHLLKEALAAKVAEAPQMGAKSFKTTGEGL